MAKKLSVADDPAFRPGAIVGYWRRDPGRKPEFVQAVLDEPDGDMAFITRLDNLEERYIQVKRLVLIKVPEGFHDINWDEEVPF